MTSVMSAIQPRRLATANRSRVRIRGRPCKNFRNV